MSGILSGVMVAEFSTGWTGAALCGRMLAELGAQVIKIEPPDGDPIRFRDDNGGTFSLLSAGKKSAVADLNQEPGREYAFDLASRADVVIDGLPNGVLERSGICAQALRELRPGLIFCAVSTFGRTGPLSEWTGADLLAQAMSGLMSTTGFPDGPPLRAGVALGEHAAAAFATTSVLAALFERHRSGQGQQIDIAATDCLFLFQSSFAPSLFVGEKAAPRQGFRHPLMAPWDVYPTNSAGVIICSGNDTQWRAMLRLFGRVDLLEDERFATAESRVAHVEDVNTLVADWTATRSAEDVIAAMHGIGVPAGPILNISELIEHQQFRERLLLVQAEKADGVEQTFGSLFKMSRTPGRVNSPAPILGAYTDELRARPKAELVQ